IEEVSIEDFQKLDIRVARIVEVDDHPKADKLYVLKIEINGEERQLVAGIKSYYKKEELINKKRIAIVEKEKCHPQKCGGYWCIGVCPVNRNEEECIQKNEQTTKIVIDENLCIGCGICVKCTFDAIKIINLPEKLKEKPVIRFGINSFELFRLPVPKENKIIGII